MKARTVIFMMRVHQNLTRMLGYYIWFWCDGFNYAIGDVAGLYRPDVAVQLGQWRS